ncbi:hypothetical protein [Pontimicrobium sp. MEBiC06410]
MKKVFSICAALLLMSSISFANQTTVKKRDICIDFAYSEALDEMNTSGELYDPEEWNSAFNFYYEGCLDAEASGDELVILPCAGNGC